MAEAADLDLLSLREVVNSDHVLRYLLIGILSMVANMLLGVAVALGAGYGEYGVFLLDDKRIREVDELVERPLRTGVLRAISGFKITGVAIQT